MGEYATGPAVPADDLLDPFPDGGLFSPTAPSGDQQETAAARRAADREAARQLSLVVPGDVAAVLAGALALAEAELPGGSPATQAPALLARVRGLAQLQNVLDAVLAQTVRAAECAQASEFDGHTTMRTWLVGHLAVSSATAGRVVRAGRTLEQLPRWAAAARAGQVTADQTAVLAKAATPARLAAAVDLGVDLHGDDGLDATLLGTATGPTPEVLPTVVARLLDWIDPDGPEPDPTRRRELHLTPSSSAEGGGTIHGRLDAAGFEKVTTALTAYQQAGRTKDDDQLACDSIITRVLFGPDGMPLNIGRAQRLVPAHIRKAAVARDGGCVFVGCTAPTWWCDAHHVREWIADHGETSVENTALLCERRHTKVHHGFHVDWDPDEHRWRTHRDDGTEIVIGHPPGHLRRRE